MHFLIFHFLLSCIISFADSDIAMENRNYVNSEYYAKLLREKIKRDSKVAKMQKHILHEQHKQQLNKAMCPKKPKKVVPEKLLKQPSDELSEVEKRRSAERTEKRFSLSDNDLLNEIDKSLNGHAKGFIKREGN